MLQETGPKVCPTMGEKGKNFEHVRQGGQRTGAWDLEGPPLNINQKKKRRTFKKGSGRRGD